MPSYRRDRSRSRRKRSRSRSRRSRSRSRSRGRRDDRYRRSRSPRTRRDRSREVSRDSRRRSSAQDTITTQRTARRSRSRTPVDRRQRPHDDIHNRVATAVAVAVEPKREAPEPKAESERSAGPSVSLPQRGPQTSTSTFSRAHQRSSRRDEEPRDRREVGIFMSDIKPSAEYDAAIVAALETFQRPKPATPANTSTPRIHPIDDFTSQQRLFHQWRVNLLKDTRPMAALRLDEARTQFARFSIEYNTMQLPLLFYSNSGHAHAAAAAGAADQDASTDLTAVERRVEITTHWMSWQELKPETDDHSRRKNDNRRDDRRPF